MSNKRADSVLGVIPARGGSKGLTDKNLRLLGGVPLVAHSIRAASGSRLISRFVVSTEDARIAAVARQHGAEVLDRPVALAGDIVRNNDVAKHALEVCGSYRYVVLLQPTTPLRTASDIDDCLAPLLDGEARSVMTVTQAEHHPEKTFQLESGQLLPYCSEAGIEARRQDLVPAYRQNGAVYALASADFLREDRFYLPPCRPFVMPAERSVDIDTEFDLCVAEQLLRMHGGS